MSKDPGQAPPSEWRVHHRRAAAGAVEPRSGRRSLGFALALLVAIVPRRLRVGLIRRHPRQAFQSPDRLPEVLHAASASMVDVALPSAWRCTGYATVAAEQRSCTHARLKWAGYESRGNIRFGEWRTVSGSAPETRWSWRPADRAHIGRRPRRGCVIAPVGRCFGSAFGWAAWARYVRLGRVVVPQSRRSLDGRASPSSDARTYDLRMVCNRLNDIELESASTATRLTPR